jgi:hypothetical protein
MSSPTVDGVDVGAKGEDAFAGVGSRRQRARETSLEACERAFACEDYASCSVLCEELYRTAALDDDDDDDDTNDDTNDENEASTSGARRGAASTTLAHGDGVSKVKPTTAQRDDTDADDVTAPTTSKFMRELYENIDHPRVRGAIRRMFRAEEYVGEMPMECLLDADAADVAAAWARVSGAPRRRRRVMARATMIWIQCVFKSSSLTSYENDQKRLAGGVDVIEDGGWGPEARCCWCKLKWEQRDGETEAIERVICDTFEYVTKHDVLGELAARDDVDDEDALDAWRDALGKMAWLYASQIVAEERDDAIEARRWLEEYRDVLDEEIVSVTHSWIDNANCKVEKYRFEATRDDDTGHVSVRNIRVHDDDKDDKDDADADADADKSKHKAGGTNGTNDRTDATTTATDAIAARQSVSARLPRLARDVLADPFGDVALRTYASAAVAAVVTYSVVIEITHAFTAWRRRTTTKTTSSSSSMISRS